jgi:hypothetical protein
MKSKFEYLVIDNAVHSAPARRLGVLNEHGSKGWELVLVDGPNFYFKRQVEENTPAAS